ncbi:D-alanyl-D-alanine carboxypeptidase / D-alanyl-D-alanine-endopeptidase (penicillin-binding protein 4) [Flagellimonas flava]|uniref:D-alanyl-D-alanine carboxypeptidase / D-alanyl-D-alanine-endopeptidase (Penicillin-binding protein 4) n=2 Tax=Flagellimonas flava TaxID=570519 RepID=A0A1M5I0Z9_9FLAO|nr:D-alanyl-D-alanine carboxypeptidase / D-alanyl-D-alanine-endopeptidase (penicillin-binding protein 4) [Allomuricauda flava]
MLKSITRKIHKQLEMRLKFFFFIILPIYFVVSSCSSSRVRAINEVLWSEPLQNSFHGLVLYDTSLNKIVYNMNGGRYFTPASNVKIVTLFTGMTLLGDNVPTLRYVASKDSILFEGTGDPAWLHPYFMDSTAIHFLKKHNTITWYPHNTVENKFGPGWAWEDYDAYFSPEKGALPLYGNVVTAFHTEELNISPQYFLEKVTVKDKPFRRKKSENQFYIPPNRSDTLEIPFVTSEALTQKLLEKKLGKPIALTTHFDAEEKQTLYGKPSDSIYRRMMYESDNFLAEQILMMASSTLSDTLSTKASIDFMLENHLADLEEQPRWVDGSGLSRYNLFTPKSLVQILQKLYQQMPQDRLFHLFPYWDTNGTSEVWKDAEVPAFIWAKSGSLGNNYNLSGYLKTKSGKLLIFSFMNNHFRKPSSEIRSQMYHILKQVYQKY